MELAFSTKMSVFFILLFTMIIHSASSQKKASEIYEYTCDFLDTYNSNDTSASPIEIQLIGSFHFRSKKWKVTPIEQEVLDFQPDYLFLEEVPPLGTEGFSKEDYKNELYANPKRGGQFYSNAIDSAVAFTGISRDQALNLIEKNRALLIEKPNDLQTRIELINALFINADEPNALLHLEYLRMLTEELEDISYDSLLQQISPVHRKYRFSMGETKYLSIPIATVLNHDELIPMDYQVGRSVNDSLLSIASKAMMPKLLGQFWKVPYFIKMMNIDKKGPKNNQEAVEHYRILNSNKTIKNIAKMHEVYLYNPQKEASRIWIESYRKRNRKMVAMVYKKIIDDNVKKATIIVGAGHVPYFLYELNQQLPQAKVILLQDKR